MSIGLVFDDINMNLFGNQAKNQRMEVVNNH